MEITIENISLLLRTFNFAAHKHQGQRRKGGQASPYINHLIDVAETLWEIGGIHDLNTIVAGILHDTLEDTETSRQELESKFGSEISSIVSEVTDDKSCPNS